MCIRVYAGVCIRVFGGDRRADMGQVDVFAVRWLLGLGPSWAPGLLQGTGVWGGVACPRLAPLPLRHQVPPHVPRSLRVLSHMLAPAAGTQRRGVAAAPIPSAPPRALQRQVLIAPPPPTHPSPPPQAGIHLPGPQRRRTAQLAADNGHYAAAFSAALVGYGG